MLSKIQSSRSGSFLQRQREQIAACSALGFSHLPMDAIVANALLLLDTPSLARFSLASKTSKNDAIVTADSRLHKLKQITQELTETPGINGIQKPEGPFKDSIHQLIVLTAFKEAILVLKNNRITDIDSKNSRGIPPLHIAARRGFTNLAKALITAGANKDLTDKDGHTPLQLAVRVGQIDVAKA